MYKKLVVLSPSFSQMGELRERARSLAANAIFNQNSIELTEKELISLIEDADAVILGLNRLSRDVLLSCTNLKVISKYGVGTDNIDFQLCNSLGIEVLTSPGSNRMSVAEFTLGCILCLHHNIPATMNRLKNGVWYKSGGVDFRNKRIGIIGLGSIGKRLSDLLVPFDVEVGYFDLVRAYEREAEGTVKYLPLVDLLGWSNTITLHVDLNDTSRGLIGEEEINLMRRGAFLINHSRGEVINYESLRKEILHGNKLAGVALDVYPYEPFSDLEFLQSEKVFCTPHIAGNSEDAILAMGHAALDALETYHR